MLRIYLLQLLQLWVSPRGVVAHRLNCSIVVSEFELQSRYYRLFRTSPLEKGMKRLIPLLWVT